MRIVISSPVPLTATAGPATVLRELTTAYEALGDEVHAVTFSSLEKKLPIGLRQLIFFVRVLPRCFFADVVLMLDPASTGPAMALAAWITGRRSLVRIGGDFLWESYVERTGKKILLSEFYLSARSLTLREKSIFFATRITLTLATDVVFTTQWQRTLWQQPYAFKQGNVHIVLNPLLPGMSSTPAEGKIFLCAHRNARIKNSEIMKEVWDIVATEAPEAVLDERNRTPKEYAQALASCYAVVLPSLSEVSPNAILEAIAHHKPFVMTRDTGLQAEVLAGGFLVNTRNAHDLAKAILALCFDETYKQKVEAMATGTAQTSWSAVAGRYRRILSSTPTHP